MKNDVIKAASYTVNDVIIGVAGKLISSMIGNKSLRKILNKSEFRFLRCLELNIFLRPA